jgi:putative tricarboxylic transport membrane protein
LRRSGYSMPGIVLGVILGKIGESNFVKTMQMLDYDPTGFLTRPVSLVFLVLTALTLVFSIRTLMSARLAQTTQ